MSSEQNWTIDSIAHALPHSTLRQRFLSEAHLAPVAELHVVLARWTRVAEECVEAQPRIEAIRAYFKEHGTLPDELGPFVDATDRIMRDAAEGRRERGAA